MNSCAVLISRHRKFKALVCGEFTFFASNGSQFSIDKRARFRGRLANILLKKPSLSVLPILHFVHISTQTQPHLHLLPQITLYQVSIPTPQYKPTKHTPQPDIPMSPIFHEEDCCSHQRHRQLRPQRDDQVRHAYGHCQRAQDFRSSLGLPRARRGSLRGSLIALRVRPARQGRLHARHSEARRRNGGI